MDKEHIKGAADKLAGATKEAVGKATDNNKMRAEGMIDKGKGAARETLGDAKDAARRANKGDPKH